MMIKKQELELYVHIPFCVKKCAYCDFLSGPAGEAERAAYVDALVREIKSEGQKYREYRVDTIFLGGGTPSVLRGEETARIFHALRENFSVKEDAEITMEVNPGTVTEEKAVMWKRSGINRLSIGLQSVNDEELQMLGRIHSYRDFLRTWKIVRETGFENVNIDLISAIPGQTADSWEKTLSAAAQLQPEHLSAYSLIVEEGTPFYERYGDREQSAGNGLPPLPDEETERRIYQMTGQILKQYGYHRYEISNYSAEGYECRHNLGYWERKEYLGLGLGAASLIREHRFHNTADMAKYMGIFGSGGRGTAGSADLAGNDTYGAAAEEIETLSEADRMEETIFLGLRKTEGIRCRDFQDEFGRTLQDVYGRQIRRFTELGLLKLEDGRLRLTERGVDVSNLVFTEFML